MNDVIALIPRFFRFLWSQKLKIALIPVFAIVWAFFLFPYSDIRSVVATKVSRALGDGFAIDFETISLSLGFPFSLSLENFEFEGPGLPAITADHVVATPSLGTLFGQSPSGSLLANGLFNGTVALHLHNGAKLKSGQKKSELNTDVADLQLDLLMASLKRAGLVGFTAQGILNMQAEASIDPLFEEQPIANVLLQGANVNIPSVSIPLPNMGPILTPSFAFSKLDFKGKLTDGKLQIEDFTFGQAKDSLSGRIRGELGLTVRKDTQGTLPIFGAYDLKIELNVSKSMMDAMSKSGLALVLLMVDNPKYKTVTPDALKYAFRLKGAQFGPAPQIEVIGN